MDVLLRNQRIRKRFRTERSDKKRRQSIADFRALKSIPVRKKSESSSFLGALFFSARPLLINVVGFLLLIAVFLLLSGKPAEVKTGNGVHGLSATLSQPVEADQDTTGQE